MPDEPTTGGDSPADEIKNEPAPETAPDMNEQPDKPEAEPRWQRLKNWYLEHKKWSIPATVVLLILILASVPYTRYQLAGLALKQNVSVKVLDATANTPVSGATVAAGSISAETNGSGVAVLHHLKVGSHQLTISKKYYQDRQVSILVPILSQKNPPDFKLTATGRQVKISVTNLITRKPLEGANIKIADITAKTDSTGSAVVVLPVGTSQQTAQLSLSGYNNADVTVQVSNDKIQDNPFTLTPSGKVYFLSKLSGKIDVVKTNLDGTDRQTVLAGTGNEDDQNTVLLASRDWKYLALLSRRAGNYPSLYLIDTSNDSVTTMDDGNASFTLIGWVNDSFAYVVDHQDIQIWQSGQQELKSYNALTKKSIVLDKTTASGTSQADFLAQTFSNSSAYGYNGQIFYVKNWQAGYNNANALLSQQATFNSVNIDGTGQKAIKSFGLASGSQSSNIDLTEEIIQPYKVELGFYDGSNYNFYTYQNGQVQADSSMNQDKFYSASYPTYLESPSASQTFWSEPRDGKNTLFLGDQYGQNSQQIATLSDYAAYGWYTDSYLLVSQNGSELYIMPTSGSSTPVKISDYNKPVVTYQGYGGGYGGI